MALSAASPFYRGYVSDIDCRWGVISASVDDRTREERGLEVGVIFLNSLLNPAGKMGILSLLTVLKSPLNFYLEWVSHTWEEADRLSTCLWLHNVCLGWECGKCDLVVGGGVQVNFHHLLKPVFVLPSKICSTIFLYFGSQCWWLFLPESFLVLHECFVCGALCCGKCNLLSGSFACYKGLGLPNKGRFVPLVCMLNCISPTKTVHQNHL